MDTSALSGLRRSSAVVTQFAVTRYAQRKTDVYLLHETRDAAIRVKTVPFRAVGANREEVDRIVDFLCRAVGVGAPVALVGREVEVLYIDFADFFPDAAFQADWDEFLDASPRWKIAADTHVLLGFSGQSGDAYAYPYSEKPLDFRMEVALQPRFEDAVYDLARAVYATPREKAPPVQHFRAWIQKIADALGLAALDSPQWMAFWAAAVQIKKLAEETAAHEARADEIKRALSFRDADGDVLCKAQETDDCEALDDDVDDDGEL
jgi:hypothetical protein